MSVLNGFDKWKEFVKRTPEQQGKESKELLEGIKASLSEVFPFLADS